MKKALGIAVILTMLLFSSCSGEPSVPTAPYVPTVPSVPTTPSTPSTPSATAVPSKPEAPDEWVPGTETLDRIPYESRLYVMSNGLEVRRAEENSNTDGTNYMRFIVSVSGFRDTGIEKKLNSTIEESLDEISEEARNEALKSSGNESKEVTSIQLSANIIYSCENVMFIDYFAYAEYPEDSGISYVQRFTSEGYDLNTGNKLKLSDLFRKDFNYEKYLNDKVMLYIIENNYDDPDAGFLSGPFKGIRDDQSFSFDLQGVKLIIDDKNDEFISLGYPLSITIPLSEIGDDLAVFDRYRPENLFLSKGTKKLLPNVVQYKPEKVFQEFTDTYALSILDGSFHGITDKVLLERLNALAKSSLDAEGFLERAKAYAETNPGVYYGSMNHDVQVIMNKGGYLGVVFMDYTYELRNEKVSRIFINCDLTKGRDVALKDLFVEGFDYELKILDSAGLNKTEASVIDEFYFDENGIYINIFQKDENLGIINNWIPFEDLGLENITLFN